MRWAIITALGRGGGAVVERGVGNIHAGELSHLGLELEQHLQRALGDFGLVRGVGGQKLRALDEVIHRGRHMVSIGPGAAEEGPRPRRPITSGKLEQIALDLHLS